MKGSKMTNNVVELKSLSQVNFPNDLMTFKELEKKHGFKYSYLYKWACLEREIQVYNRGSLKLSEAEVLNFVEKRVRKYGRN